MNKIIVILNMLMALTLTARGGVVRQLEKVLARERFFELRDLYADSYESLSPFHRLYYRAYLDNVFGRTASSTAAVDSLLADYADNLNRDKKSELLMLKANNLTKEYAYGAAADVMQQILGDYRSALDRRERKDVANSLHLWQALRDVPPQVVCLESDTPTHVSIARNRMNHWTIPVNGESGESIEFVFDSGANLSTLRKGVAQRLGVQFTGSKIEVGNSVGSSLEAEYGYIPRLMIGDLAVENVVVLVLPDSVMTFAQIDYTIDGIIGFPVIRGLGEFSISREGRLSIAAERGEAPGLQNLFTKGLTPFVRVGYNGEQLTMIFDTGALTSHLSRRYYRSHWSYVRANAKVTRTNMGGAGKIKQVRNRHISDAVFEVAGRCIPIPGIDVVLSKTAREERNDGFLGQDILLQPAQVVINLEGMYLYFRD